jgi:hypothetical protein
MSQPLIPSKKGIGNREISAPFPCRIVAQPPIPAYPARSSTEDPAAWLRAAVGGPLQPKDGRQRLSRGDWPQSMPQAGMATQSAPHVRKARPRQMARSWPRIAATAWVGVHPTWEGGKAVPGRRRPGLARILATVSAQAARPSASRSPASVMSSSACRRCLGRSSSRRGPTRSSGSPASLGRRGSPGTTCSTSGSDLIIDRAAHTIRFPRTRCRRCNSPTTR